MITETAIFLLILFIAGVVQGTAGFGFGLVAITFLSFAMDLRDSSVNLTLVSLSVNLLILWRLRKSFSFERITPLLICSVVGVPFGLLLLVHADEHWLKRILGLILLATVCQSLLPKLSEKSWHPLWLGIPSGLFSGALSGAFATGGPPVVAYISTQGFKRLHYVACVQAVLAVSAVIRIVVLGANGSLHASFFSLGLTGAVAACSGALLGLVLLKKINQDIFKKIVLAILATMAIFYITTG